MMVNWSSLPIPQSRIHRTSLTLNRLSGGENGQETISIAVCEWMQNGMKVHLQLSDGNSAGWAGLCESQFTISTVDYQDSTVEFDITYAVQHAHATALTK